MISKSDATEGISSGLLPLPLQLEKLPSSLISNKGLEF